MKVSNRIPLGMERLHAAVQRLGEALRTPVPRRLNNLPDSLAARESILTDAREWIQTTCDCYGYSTLFENDSASGWLKNSVLDALYSPIGTSGKSPAMGPNRRRNPEERVVDFIGEPPSELTDHFVMKPPKLLSSSLESSLAQAGEAVRNAKNLGERLENWLSEAIEQYWVNQLPQIEICQTRNRRTLIQVTTSVAFRRMAIPARMGELIRELAESDSVATSRSDVSRLYRELPELRGLIEPSKRKSNTTDRTGRHISHYCLNQDMRKRIQFAAAE